MELVLNTFGTSLNRDNEGFVVTHKDGRQRIPPLPRKYVSVSDAGYVTSVFSLVPGNWLLLKTVLAVNVWKRRACSVFLLIPYRCISSFFCIALDLLFSFQQNGQFADSSFFPLGSAG